MQNPSINVIKVYNKKKKKKAQAYFNPIKYRFANKKLHKNILKQAEACQIYAKNEKYNIFFNYILKNQKLKIAPKKREKIQEKYNKLNFFRSKSRIKNTCFITGRQRSVSKKYSLTRAHLKQQANAGLILGLKKSSW